MCVQTVNEKVRQKVRKAFLDIPDSETRRSNKIRLQARNLASENKSKLVAEKRGRKDPVSMEQLLLCSRASFHGRGALQSTGMSADPWNGGHGWLFQGKELYLSGQYPTQEF